MSRTPGQYAAFRFVFGAYLAVHLAMLLPWGAEIFSSAGVLPAAASPLLHAFPNLFLVADTPLFVGAVLAAGVLLAVALAFGVRDRVAALLLWWLWASLFGRNPLIANPGLPFVGWLLVVHAAGAGRDLFVATWILMALGYTYSGYTKLVSASWRDGSALGHVLDSPLARPGGVAALLRQLPPGVLRLLSFGALGCELGFAPLALFSRLRPLAWAALLGMHVGLIAVVDFADLSLGMVMLHLFTFDPAWVHARGGAATVTVPAGATRLATFIAAEDPTHHLQRREGARFEVARGAESRQGGDALVWLLEGFGGAWRLGGALLGRAPRAWRDRLAARLAG